MKTLLSILIFILSTINPMLAISFCRNFLKFDPQTEIDEFIKVIGKARSVLLP